MKPLNCNVVVLFQGPPGPRGVPGSPGTAGTKGQKVFVQPGMKMDNSCRFLNDFYFV